MREALIAKRLSSGLGITPDMIYKVVDDLLTQGILKKGGLEYSPYEKNLILLQSLFPEKILSEKDTKIIDEMIDSPPSKYIKGSDPYKKALRFSQKFPDLWKIAKEIIRIYDIVWLRKRTKRDLDFINNLCSKNPTINEIITTEKVDFLWENIKEKDTGYEGLLKELKEILDEPRYKDYFIRKLLSDVLFFGSISF
ncbi:hypothetical protein KKA39_00070 [Patescibacteria group bacterium]|nr:hypothetical protein [Patescibacteria group bacterium]MBU1727708.1 hypothetical protein [Patescibacteria group bacterium]